MDTIMNTDPRLICLKKNWKHILKSSNFKGSIGLANKLAKRKGEIKKCLCNYTVMIIFYTEKIYCLRKEFDER